MASFSLPWPFRRRGGATAAAGGGKSGESGDSEEAEERRLEEFGVTQKLRDFVKGFTVATFKEFPIQDDCLVEGSVPSKNVRKDLTDWQERHATMVLSKVKEISQLRYVLCPRHLKEEQFWRIYFLLVKRYMSPYEMRAIHKAKLARTGLENEKPVESGVIEVQMTVTKRAVEDLNILQPHSDGETD